VVAGVLNGRLKRGEPVTVHLAGGDLVIVWTEDGRVLMTGPAETTADGVYYYNGRD
jgi:diaminopimelate epimerase